MDDGSDDGGGGGTPHGSPSRHAAGDLGRGGGKGKKACSGFAFPLRVGGGSDRVGGGSAPLVVRAWTMGAMMVGGAGRRMAPPPAMPPAISRVAVERARR